MHKTKSAQRLTEEMQIGPFAALKDKAEAVPGAFGTYDCLYAHMVAVTRLKQYEDAMPLERAQELSQAEKDGRLVVLPDAKYTEADGEKALQKAMWTCGNTNNPVTRYTADAIAEKLCREAKEENPPLTLKELCEMDGEPVWVESFIRGLASHWAIVHGKYLSDGRFSDDMERCLLSADKNSGYGIAWIAYRRKKDS